MILEASPPSTTNHRARISPEPRPQLQSRTRHSSDTCMTTSGNRWGLSCEPQSTEGRTQTSPSAPGLVPFG